MESVISSACATSFYKEIRKRRNGVPYGIWADTVDAINERTEMLNEANDSLEKWKAYAKKLEKVLDEVTANFSETKEMYYDMAGAEKGQAALKEESLKELQKLDPSNKMLGQSQRKVIYDQAYNDTVARLKKK